MDLAAAVNELEKLNGLKAQYVRSKDEIERESRKYATVSSQQARELYDAHLLDQDEYTAVNYHLAEILHSNLSLEENQVALYNRMAEVQRNIASLKLIQTALENGTPLPPTGDLSYQVLHIKEDHTHSITELANARNTRDVHVQNLSALDVSIDRYDRILKEIHNSPYLKAVDENLNIAFVPYDNVQGVRPNVSVYECRLGLVFCRKAGKVVETLEGEVQGRHPLHASYERGLMVRLDLKSPQTAKESILFLSRPPLLF